MTAPQLLHDAVNLAALARELAMDIDSPDKIRRSFELNDIEFAQIMRDPSFARMLNDMVLEWRSMAGTAERIAVKSRIAVEVAIEVMLEEIVNNKNPLAQRVEAVKTLARLGDLGAKDVAGGGVVGGGISISINLGTPGEGRPPKTINLKANVEHELPDEQLEIEG